MPYIQNTIYCGKVIEIEKKYTFKLHSKKVFRSSKKLPTTEAQKRLNEAKAIKRLRRLVNTNFQHKDYHLVLSYESDKRPSTKDNALANITNFLRRARRIYTKIGLQFKYILTSEYGKNAIHHHLIVNKIDTEKLQAIWPYGRIHVNPLDNSGQYEQLASYLIKQTRKTFNDEARQLHKKRWCQSSNLEQPIIKTEVVKADSWRDYPTAPVGYVITKLHCNVDEYTGWPYQSYTMVQIPSLFPEIESEKMKHKRKYTHHHGQGWHQELQTPESQILF